MLDAHGKAKNKLSQVFSHPDSVCPDSSVVEQASGFLAARYVADKIDKDVSVADLTAGLGVNTYWFSRRAARVFAVELDEHRARVLEHNLSLEGVRNVTVVCADCLEWLKDSSACFQTAYADPARRSNSGRFFLLKDCSPDVDLILEYLKCRKNSTPCSRLLVKVSPLLDIHDTLNKYPDIRAVDIIESNREVKELLLDFHLEAPSLKAPVVIRCAVLTETSTEIFEIQDPMKFKDYSIPLLVSKKELQPEGYIYEPSPAFMKAQAFAFLHSLFPQVKKLGANTHLFYSNAKIEGFPGRAFRIKGLLQSSDLKKLKGSSFCVVSRNHPATAQELTDRFGLSSSDSAFLIACTVGKDKTIVSCEKVF